MRCILSSLFVEHKTCLYFRLSSGLSLNVWVIPLTVFRYDEGDENSYYEELKAQMSEQAQVKWLYMRFYYVVLTFESVDEVLCML